MTKLRDITKHMCGPSLDPDSNKASVQRRQLEKIEHGLRIR